MKIEIPDQLPDGLPDWAKTLAAEFKSGGILPRDRFNEEVARVRTTEQAAAGDWKTKAERAMGDLDLAEAGVVSKDVRELVRWRHGQLPEQGRKPLNEWAKADAWEDPILKPHRPGQAAATTTNQTQAPAAPAAGQAPPAAPPQAAPPTPANTDAHAVPNPEPGLKGDLAKVPAMNRAELTAWLQTQGMAG
jgi:hypothetical protein